MGPLKVTACVWLLSCTVACNPWEKGKDSAPDATPLAGPAAEPRRDYERHIDRFADGTPAADVKAAQDALEAAGVDAFPTLVTHFGDGRVADEVLWGAIAGSKTVGDVCFDVLQGQVEGDWSKAWRHLRVLTPENAAAWLEARQGRTLAELRRDAAGDGLRNVEAALAANPSSQGLRAFADTLRQRTAGRS